MCLCVCVRAHVLKNSFTCFQVGCSGEPRIEDHKEGIQSYPFAFVASVFCCLPHPRNPILPPFFLNLFPYGLPFLSLGPFLSVSVVAVCSPAVSLLIPRGKDHILPSEVSPVSLHTNVAQLPCSFSLTLFLLLLLTVDKPHLFDFTSLVMLGV